MCGPPLLLFYVARPFVVRRSDLWVALVILLLLVVPARSIHHAQNDTRVRLISTFNILTFNLLLLLLELLFDG